MDSYTLSNIYSTQKIYLPVYTAEYEYNLTEELNLRKVQLLIISRSISDNNELKLKQAEIINRLSSRLPEHCKPFHIINITASRFDISFLKDIPTLKKILMMDLKPFNIQHELKMNESFSIDNLSVVCTTSAIAIDNDIEAKKKMWTAITTI